MPCSQTGHRTPRVDTSNAPGHTRRSGHSRLPTAVRSECRSRCSRRHCTPKARRRAQPRSPSHCSTPRAPSTRPANICSKMKTCRQGHRQSQFTLSQVLMSGQRPAHFTCHCCEPWSALGSECRHERLTNFSFVVPQLDSLHQQSRTCIFAGLISVSCASERLRTHHSRCSTLHRIPAGQEGCAPQSQSVKLSL
jgi:hypothetical protein